MDGFLIFSPYQMRFPAVDQLLKIDDSQLLTLAVRFSSSSELACNSMYNMFGGFLSNLVLSLFVCVVLCYVHVDLPSAKRRRVLEW